MNRRLLIGLVLAVAVSQLLLWWLQPAPKPKQSAGPPRSSYSLKNFDLEVLTRQGHIGFTLKAPQLQRREADASLFIDQPRFTLPAEGGNYWLGTAEHGWVSADGTLLKLSGKVALDRPATSALGKASIRTANLTAWPTDKRLASPAATEIREPGRILAGTGMKADLTTHTLELLANVHGTLEPSHGN